MKARAAKRLLKRKARGLGEEGLTIAQQIRPDRGDVRVSTVVCSGGRPGDV